MTATMLPNGKTRKTLADQLDRLDKTLDGLAEALNEAVADAVRDVVGAVVRNAVQATLREVFTNPVLHERLCPSAAESGAGPQRACRCRLLAALVWGRARDALRAGWAAATAGLVTAGGRVRGALAVCWRWRGPLAGAAGVGMVVGLGCFLGGPLVSAGVGGLTGFAAALGAKALWWIRRLWPNLAADRADF
jgi:hypothetical protein